MKITYLITERGKEWTPGDNCDFIEEHRARGDGDRWFYDVWCYEEKQMIRIFDPLEVWFLDEEEEAE